MKIFILLLHFLYLNSLFVSSKSSQDPCTSETLFKLSMFNERDVNGKWKADVFLNKCSNETSSDERDFHMTVKQTVVRCKCSIENYIVEVNVVAPPPRPSKDYTHLSGHGYYRFHSTPHTWSDASSVCNGENTHLAVVTSAEEAHHASLMLSERAAAAAFVGFRRSTQGQFLTLYGERQPLWDGSVPSDGVTEYCGIIESTGNFNVISCDEMLPYLCEQEE